MNELETTRVVARMVLLGLLPKAADAQDSKLRAHEWSKCLSGVSEDEAGAAVTALGMRTREFQRGGPPLPGDLLEVVYANRRNPLPNAGALPPGPPCEHCEGSGFEIVERDGIERHKPCRCRARK